MTTEAKTHTFEQEWRKQYDWATDALRDARQPGFRYHKTVAVHDGMALRDRLADWQESLTMAIEWVRYLTELYHAVQFVRLNEIAPAPANGWSAIQSFNYDLFVSSHDYEDETQQRGRILVSEWRESAVLDLPDHLALVKLMDAHGKWPY